MRNKHLRLDWDTEFGEVDAAVWIARQHNEQLVRLPSGVLDYWKDLGLTLLVEQLGEHPPAPLLPRTEHEEPWQTFLRLLDTQSEILGNPAPSKGSKAGKGGALLWHLFAPDIGWQAGGLYLSGRCSCSSSNAVLYPCGHSQNLLSQNKR